MPCWLEFLQKCTKDIDPIKDSNGVILCMNIIVIDVKHVLFVLELEGRACYIGIPLRNSYSTFYPGRFFFKKERLPWYQPYTVEEPSSV